MKPIALFFVSAAVAAATSAIVLTMMREQPSSGSAHAATPTAGGDVAHRLDEIERRNAEIAKKLDELDMKLDAKAAPARVPVGEIDAAVQRAIASQGTAGAADAGDAKKAAKAAPAVDAASLFAEYQAGNLDWDARRDLFKRAAEAGVIDELVAMFEKHAKDNPNDPHAQVELGQAYLQKTFTAPDGPERGLWSMKADKSFDAAIALDDHNWEARYAKGVSLSFWPPILGKQNEALEQFQTLVQQQDNQPQQPQFAQTHWWLGNMYQQMGQKEKAIAAWQHGLSLFPNDEQLQHQIQLAQQH
jgi:tetratricopeptide (TPR) repeat protein